MDKWLGEFQQKTCENIVGENYGETEFVENCPNEFLDISVLHQWSWSLEESLKHIGRIHVDSYLG